MVRLEASGVRIPTLGDVLVLLMLFAQTLSTQILAYPLALVSIVRNANRLLPARAVAAGCVLFGYVALSILLRGGSIELMAKLLQFYFGIVLLTLAFWIDRSLRVGTGMMWIFVAVVFYEISSSNLFGIEPFLYWHSDLVGVGAAARANLGFGLSRAYGPALNSSVSGSILAIMFFFIIFRSRDLVGGGHAKWKYLAVSVFLALVLCGSATSYMVFIVLLVCHLAGRMNRVSGDATRRASVARLAVGPLAVVGIAVGLALGFYFLSGFVDALIEAKMNIEYFEFIWNLKSEQASQALSFSSLLLGADLAGVLPGNTGGDFVLLDALVKIGLLGVLGLFALLYAVCPRENRLFLLAGWLSSMHYGTIFSLCGQVFFGALCANSLSLTSPAGARQRLSRLEQEVK